MASPAINGTVTVRARSTSDRANGLPGTLLGTVVINTCGTASYPSAPSNGCYGTIALPGTLSADTYLFTASYSGTHSRSAPRRCCHRQRLPLPQMSNQFCVVF